LKRGRRLDETVPGTGLGLSIVVDLASLYNGRLDLGRSPSGGLEATLTLPRTNRSKAQARS
jgi:signal transduction histidine kinase